MEITITTPGDSPVTLESLKLHLSMNDDSADDLLTEWLETAVEVLSDATGFVPTETTLTATLTEWPTDGVVTLPRRPVTEVTSVIATNQDGDNSALTFLARGSLVTITSDEPADLDAITITFTAGAACPARFKTVVKMLAAHFYANREAFSDTALAEIPVGYSYVVQQLRGSLGVSNA